MHIKIHFVTSRKLLQKLSQLLQSIEKHYSPASVEIVGLDKPNVSAIIHFISDRKLTIDDSFKPELWLDSFIL
mgnify:CR=1 FL=1